jgi:2-keto-3-deoxygluconate permease
VPAIVASANPDYAAAAGPATILIAACVVVTAILTPIATAWIAGIVGKDVEPEDEATEAATPTTTAPAAGR